MPLLGKNGNSVVTNTTIKTSPFDGQKAGTNGIRKKTKVFMQTHYLENYVQSIFDALGGMQGKTLVLGGDGRFHNNHAIQVILKMAAANGLAKVIVGQNGLLSTPSVSHLIRKYKADGGIILSASHNPAGPEEDFGIKVNDSNGGSAPENLTEKIYQLTTKISVYKIALIDDVDVSVLAAKTVGELTIEVIDPVTDYLQLMTQLFDFDAIRALFTSGFQMRFDAMNAITGPYATVLFERMLGARSGTVINGDPKEDFNGKAPDPNQVQSKALVDLMMGENAPDFCAASDGDGDRNMIVGRGIFIEPSDSLAVLAANAHIVPAYASGLAGVARSMPTSAAVDQVAKKLGIPTYETPTGWKFFGNLLDANKVTLCGEESASAGSNHIREKDGLWAVLFWLNIIAVRKQSVSEIMNSHWEEFGRNHFSRLDFKGLENSKANEVVNHVRRLLKALPSKSYRGLKVTAADEFRYLDPVDGSMSGGKGLRIWFEGDRRAVLRLSGTGTQGATLRVYVEQYLSPDKAAQHRTEIVLAPLVDAVCELAQLEYFLGRVKPDKII